MNFIHTIQIVHVAPYSRLVLVRHYIYEKKLKIYKYISTYIYCIDVKICFKGVSLPNNSVHDHFPPEAEVDLLVGVLVEGEQHVVGEQEAGQHDEGLDHRRAVVQQHHLRFLYILRDTPINCPHYIQITNNIWFFHTRKYIYTVWHFSFTKSKKSLSILLLIQIRNSRF